MSGNTAYPRLFSPMKLGPRTARNRVWMTAHATLLVKDNLFTDAHIHYYKERAKGGVAVITMEAMAAHPTTQPYKGKAFAFDPRMAAQYRKLADAVHEYDTLLLSQPWHRGRQTNSVANGLPVWAPSAIPCSVYREMPHVMTTADINELIEGYRLSAKYSKEGGLDGVEVHGMSHGYMLNQFLSPATNNRRDAYGGSLENRMRIVMEILDASRQEIGRDMIMGMRINSNDGHPGGLGPDEWADIAKEFEATGLIDYISVSHGTYLNRMLIYPTSPEDQGYQLAATQKVADAVSVPVVGVGRIIDPAAAEGYLADGKCEFIGMARQLIADPEWPKKAYENKAGDIRPCVGANWCMSSIFAQAAIACIHNPAAGDEMELGAGTLRQAETAKKVAVVGAGPGGMRAALTAAGRGHDVTLFEARDNLGGQTAWWAKADSRKELVGIVDWLETQLRQTGATIQTGTKVDAAMLAGFDTVIVATGSRALKHGWNMLHPERWDGDILPGADQPHVFTYMELLRDEPPVGKKVVVIDSMGGRQGAVTTEYLAQRGASVTFITQLGQPSPDLAGSRDWGKVHGMLRRMGVTFMSDSEVTAIDGPQVTVRDLYTDENTLLNDIDQVVMIIGADAEDGLFHELSPRKADGLELHLIGDAMSPRRVNDAIREGELVARKI